MAKRQKTMKKLRKLIGLNLREAKKHRNHARGMEVITDQKFRLYKMVKPLASEFIKKQYKLLREQLTK